MRFDIKSKKAEEFINHQEILKTIENGKKHKEDKNKIQEILTKARNLRGLDYDEAFTLLSSDDPLVEEEIFSLAKEIKNAIYGDRIVLFAPLYLSNYCVNGCSYCPYHMKNKSIQRKKLTQDQIRQEVIALENMGHKRLAIEAGEDPENNPIEYILESIKTIYSVHHRNGDIRRVNVNIAATTVEEYKMLRDAKIGTYILFQETYNKASYEKLHPTGPKSDYSYHTEAMDRAMEAGIDDVGLGVLFGLENYEYDFVGLLMHAKHLEETFGVGPHTVSVPRIRPATGIDPTDFDNSLDDHTFSKIIAILRISMPYVGMIMSTRESKEMRQIGLDLGISQISGASKTSVGGYSDYNLEDENTQQFDTEDNRTLDELVSWLIDQGKIPSFCTACYRNGRTGDRFMSLAKTGQIGNICSPNALMTLQEYLEDYASEDTKAKGTQVIKEKLTELKDPKVEEITRQNLQRIHAGSRDFTF